MIVVSQSAIFVINRVKRWPTFCLSSFELVKSWLNSKLYTFLTIFDSPNSNLRIADLVGMLVYYRFLNLVCLR